MSWGQREHLKEHFVLEAALEIQRLGWGMERTFDLTPSSSQPFLMH